MPDLYYYGDEANQFSFFRIPKALITSPQFKSVSTEAKLLYGLLLDRMELSTANGWLDDNNRVYIFYTIEEIASDISCGKNKAIRLLDSLESVGLVERIRQGRGMPSRLYIKRFSGGESYKKKNFQNGDSRIPKTGIQEVSKSNPNNTDKNKTDMNNTEISIYPSARMDAMDQIRSQLNYPYLSEQYPFDNIDEIISLLADAVCSTAKTIMIGGDSIPTQDVVRRFASLDHSHIEYVIESLHKNNAPIRNVKRYLLTALYNAPLTIGQYYYAAASEAARGEKRNE